MKWTKEQQSVIDLRDRDLLVSAAAGSGKTAVLVERIISRITRDETPLDIDQLLVVTFTRAAAAEMRERVGAAVNQLCEQQPENAHLRRQSALVHNAMITTIDSFCLFVVRNHFEDIGLDPNFRISDEGEMKLLEQDVLKQVFEENYGEGRESFLNLIDSYAGKRSDQAVKDMVLKLYHFSLSSPWPREWLAQLTDSYRVSTVEELEKTPMLRDIAEHCRLLILDAVSQEEALLSLALAQDGPNAYAKTLEQDLAYLKNAQEITEFAAMNEFFRNLKFQNLSAIRKFTGDEGKKTAVANGRNAIKKELGDLKKNYFSGSMEELLEQLKRLRPVAEELVRLALSYTDAMDQAKRKKRIVDFSDIEHFALNILVDEKTRKSRPAAGEFREHFAEIMIDEYQDSNQVQEEILKAVSREEEGGHNLFMVGDVKQSIYRFRLARPELFMEKYASFSTEESERQRIDLHENFRSRGQVLDFCNDIFYKIMSPDLGRVSYDSDAALHGGGEYPENPGMEAELLLLDTADELLTEEKSQSSRQLEAHMVAARIEKLMEETMVLDKESGELRPLRYSDIVILFRSLKDWGTEFAGILAEHGIPAFVESSTGYFSAIEVQTVLNMLRILDNPYQDIPMAAVLKSPMAGLDDEELAQIRVEDRDHTFAEAAIIQMRQQEEGPLHDFYEVYMRLRGERELPVHELIQKILEETGYGNYVQALPAGERRGANIAMLVEKAVDFEKTSYKGLFHFVRYIEALQTYEIDFGEADSTSENADVVRIMTIHKSKGLEFPVVFVSGLSKRFNRTESNEMLVVHPDLGMGFGEISGRPRVKKNCILRTEIADRLRRENLGEELRILYVAMTRAKEKLILTGSICDEAKTISGYTGNVADAPISYRQRAGASCYLDWILPAMLSYPEKYNIETIDPRKLVGGITKKLVQERLDYGELMTMVVHADEKLVSRYEKLFSYQYPYREELQRKSKYSVSELKHASMVLTFDRKEGETEVPDFLKNDREHCVPSFALSTQEQSSDSGHRGVSPGALRGTAVHRVMECLDFGRLASLDTGNPEEVAEFVKLELSRMHSEGELDEASYGLVYPEMIEAFVRDPVAARMAAAAVRGELYREKPFVMEHEGVLVQGIIDVFWMEGDSIVVLDYKTDRVGSGKELVDRYQTQLELYAEALCKIFSTKEQVKTAEERLIYSFRLQEVVKL